MNVSLINLRMKQCPYYPSLAIQQIIAYGRWEQQVDEDRTLGIARNPFLLIFAKLFEPDATLPSGRKFRSALVEHLERNLGKYSNSIDSKYPNLAERERELIELELRSLRARLEEKQIPRYIDERKRKSLEEERERNNQKSLLFSVIDWRELSQIGPFPLRAELKNYEMPPVVFSLPKKLPSDKRVDFAIAACIRDRPGTLHSLLEELTPESGSKEESQEPFCFNIDYLITDYIGIYNLYHVELYVSYRVTEDNAKNPGPCGSENVQGVVFYHRSDLPSKLPRCLKDELGLIWLNENLGDAQIEKNIRYHLDSIYTTEPLLVPHMRISSFHRDREIDNVDRLLPVLNCPISRAAGCPTPLESTRGTGELYPVKFHLIMQDRPGALKTFIELVGRGKMGDSGGLESVDR